MFWIAQMGDQSTQKIVGYKMPSLATILARQRKDLVSPLRTITTLGQFENLPHLLHFELPIETRQVNGKTWNLP